MATFTDNQRNRRVTRGGHPGLLYDLMDEINQLQVKRRLRVARELAGLTQLEVAGRVGVTEKAVSMWERDTVDTLPTRRLRDLAALYDVAYEWLAFGEGSPPPVTGTSPADAAGFEPVLAELRRLQEQVAEMRQVLEDLRRPSAPQAGEA